MHNWKRRREIPWATFCSKRKNLFFSFKQKDDHTCHIIKYSVTVPVLFDEWNQELEASGTDKWRRKHKNCTNMVGAHSRLHFFRKMNGCLLFWSIQKPVMFWKQSEGFKHPFIYWKLWSGMCTSHLLAVLSLSVPFVCSTFLVSLIVKH